MASVFGDMCAAQFSSGHRAHYIAGKSQVFDDDWTEPGCTGSVQEGVPDEHRECQGGISGMYRNNYVKYGECL